MRKENFYGVDGVHVSVEQATEDGRIIITCAAGVRPMCRQARGGYVVIDYVDEHDHIVFTVERRKPAPPRSTPYDHCRICSGPFVAGPPIMWGDSPVHASCLAEVINDLNATYPQP